MSAGNSVGGFQWPPVVSLKQVCTYLFSHSLYSVSEIGLQK